MLDGNPFSLFHSALLVLAQGPEWLRDLMEKSAEDAHSSIAAAFVSSYQQQLGFLQAMDSPACSPSEYKEAQHSIAIRFMEQYTVYTGLGLLQPMMPYVSGMKSIHPSSSRSSSSNPSEVLGLPSDARVESVTAALNLSKEQLQKLLQGLHFFGRLQQPLDQREAAVYAKIKHLLSTGALPSPHACTAPAAATAAPGATGAAAMAAAMTQLNSGASDSVETAVRSRSSTTAASHLDSGPSIFAATAAAAAGAHGATGWAPPPAICCTNSPCKLSSSSSTSSQVNSCDPHAPQQAPTANFGFLGDSAHQELETLVSELKGIQYRLKWYDTCCIGFILGQLTWKQVATFLVQSYPHFPFFLLWARRLVTRASIAWVPLATGQT
jgi:hypothetical protein